MLFKLKTKAFMSLMSLMCLCAYLLSTVHASEPILPLPTELEFHKEKAIIGEKLFFDVRLSSDDSTSCASCHAIDGWGAEDRDISIGIEQQKGDRNSPTVFNSVFNFKQFWDGRADSLSHQAEEPVVNPVEMGMATWDSVVEKIENDAYYIKAFEKSFDGQINKKNITDAISEYEKSLVTLNSPFDQFLRGDVKAISERQKKGYQLFKSYGCVACHQGANVGGNMFQKFGVLEDISLQSGDLSSDLGRYNVTRNEWDKRVFKVPSLRLVTKTAPYFHNGSVATIEEAVDIMIVYQLGRTVPDEDRDAIIAFLGSLVGDKPQGLK